MNHFTKLVFAGVAAAVIAMRAMAQQKPRVLKFQSSQNSGDFTYQYLTTKWAPKIEVMSGGTLKLEILPTKAVVPHRETLNAISAGILDGDLNAVSYFAGIDPAYGMLGDLMAG